MLSRKRPSNQKILTWFLYASLSVSVLASTGCHHSIQPEAIKVSQAGSTTAKQLADYYGSLADDTERTWELTAFRDAYGVVEAAKKQQSGLPETAPAVQSTVQNGSDSHATLSATSTDPDPLYEQFQIRYEALLARKRMAEKVEQLYDAYTHLTDYNATGEIIKSSNDLLDSVKTVTKKPLGTLGSDANTIADGALTDLITDIGVTADNRAIRKANDRIIPVLTDLQKFYEAESKVYQSIPEARAGESRAIAKFLVKKKVVVSTTLLTDILSQYGLSWPDPQQPFSDDSIVQGIAAMIDARSKPLQTASQSAGNKLDSALTQLIAMHKQLQVDKPISAAEFIENSSTIQILLDQLKVTTTSKDLADLIKQYQRNK